uniref:C-type lectin domain-containing protein n=1 Tax=Scophthalmus maximus TaxID=52904 RepID=A0A8D3CH25_SCOMX
MTLLIVILHKCTLMNVGLYVVTVTRRRRDGQTYMRATVQQTTIPSFGVFCLSALSHEEKRTDPPAALRSVILSLVSMTTDWIRTDSCSKASAAPCRYRTVSHCPQCRLQTDGVIRRFHAVNEKMSWTEAQGHCRDQFTDLATIQDPSSNAELQNITGEYTDPTAWIGLYRHSWLWSDRSGAPYRQWASKQPDVKDNKCVTMDASSADWHSNDCTVNMLC